jgi:hypothetical protein
MNILLLTALFPPDVSQPSAYAKKLATVLAADQNNQVQVLHYGELPEQVPGATIHSIKKDAPKLKRIWSYTQRLMELRTSNDVLIILNGPSVEIPFLLLAPILHRKKIICIKNDSGAAKKSPWLSLVVHFAHEVVTPGTNLSNVPLRHPLDEAATEHVWQQYQQSWKDHCDEIIALCQKN